MAIIDLELIDGFNLYEYVSRVLDPDHNIARYFFNQILEALNHLHNVVKFAHRDLKLDNIMIEHKVFEIKIIDLGFAT